MERITVTQAQHIAPPILLSVGSLLPDKAKSSAAPEKISNVSHFQSSRISQFRQDEPLSSLYLCVECRFPVVLVDDSVNGHLNVVRVSPVSTSQ
jgi:hypothetical protein